MVQERIPVLLLSIDTSRRLGRRLKGLGDQLAKLTPQLGITLSKIGIDIRPGEYIVGSIFSSFIYGLLFFAFVMLVLTLQGEAEQPLYMALGTSAGMWLMFFALHMAYPAIILKKVAMKESRDMLFALREVMIDVNSGVPLFWAVKNVANAGYGYVSRDFMWAVRQIESGVSERDALKHLAVRTESEYLKRALWQVVNALETGAALGSALAGIVQSVEEYIYRDIKNYSSNLNFLMLIYMFAAAVVPSLGVTFLVLLSAFSDFGVTIGTVLALVLISAVAQIVMIGYMRTTRPEIFGG